ncbi:MAG TPA: hypothetical protein VMP67_01930, partial [Candidatus Limnocylindria bacterium]|nr:hypothetical protein [Candidatus Limnocylindria bacterium]
LAGGSSNAAAALELAAACWGLGLSAEMRLELASILGSDVPFFMTGAPAALVEGRGERVTPLPPLTGRPGLLLVAPPLAVSTARAFARFDELPARDRPTVTDELVAAWRADLDAPALVGWAERLRASNDLWPAAVLLAPGLEALRAALEAGTDRPWLMSGSGSSLFTLYASPDEAAEAGQRLTREMSAELTGARLYATDLHGPDPVWRQP